jgi:predicted ATPase
MAEVSVNLLGGFAAAIDGAPVPEKAWRLKKARELVKLLALAPAHRLHREQAMDVLWPDRGPAAAANNLNQAVHVARRALGAGAIELRDEVLFLVAELDVDLLERAASDARRSGTAGAYKAALSLYRGELLPENRYDDWAETRRDELAALADELAAELDELGSSAAARSALPAETSSFVGRERELTELTSLLHQTRLLTLSGAGGSGKTRLALELARGAEPSYAAGAAIVELGALTDGSLVLDAVANALDVRALPGQELIDAVIDFLAPRALLLVLDNCEHLLTAAITLSDALLRSAPQLTIVATSREPLRLAGEVVFRVPSLDIPDPERRIPIEELARYESVLLFVERAAAAAPGFVLDEENMTDVARICFRLDGLPLALELAAGRLGALSPAAIAERLADRFRLLRTGSHAAPTRQQTLTATLQWSHDLLEPDERVLFRRLACFTGGFELEAVEDVCTGDELPAAEVADVLARVTEKSLVAVDDGGGRDRRYRLLETVRLYARERLDEAGEQATLAGRHARWAVGLAERERESPRLDRDAANLLAALDTLLASEPREALRLCLALWPFWLRRIDLHVAKRRFVEALAAAPECTALRADALHAAAAIDYRSGTLSQGLVLAEESLAAATAVGDARAEWRALQVLGEFGIAGDEMEVAMLWLDRALVHARREGFAAREALGIYSLGVANWILGDLPRADELVAESIELFRGLEGSPELIPSLLNIADFRMSQPDDRPVIRLVFEDTLQPFAEISSGAAVGYALANQAGLARIRGDHARARALLDESGARFDAANDDAGRATVRVRRAYLAHAEGDLPDASAQLESVLELRRQLGDRRGAGLALAGLGLFATSAGDYARAERHLTDARELFQRSGDRWGLASTLWRIADLAFARGDVEGAEAALQEARSVLGATRRERWIANTLAGLAEVAVHRGDIDEATVLLEDARDRYAARDDAQGVEHVEERLRSIAKSPLRRGKEALDTTSRTVTTKRRTS